MEKTIKLLLIVVCMAIGARANAQNVNAPGGQTTNTVPKWNPGAAFTLTNSQISDNTDVKIATGSFELTTTSKSFNIGSATPVLWHKGNSTNIFVGEGAGNANTTGSGNTFVGNNAGNNNISNDGNTFVGYQSGKAQVTGSENTFIGWESGLKSNGGGGNVYIGVKAGHENVQGGGNVLIGQSSGYNTLRSNNVYIGTSPGKANIYSIDDVFLGFDAPLGATFW